jgi:hypothetical protein
MKRTTIVAQYKAKWSTGRVPKEIARCEFCIKRYRPTVAKPMATIRGEDEAG